MERLEQNEKVREELLRMLELVKKDSVLYRRILIVLKLMEGHEDLNIARLVGSNTQTVRRVREKFLAEGIHGLYEKKELKAALISEKTYPCNLPFLVDTPTLFHLFIDHAYMVALFRTEPSGFYDPYMHAPDGVVKVRGLTMTSLLDGQVLNGPLSLTDTIRLMAYQPLKASHHLISSTALPDAASNVFNLGGRITAVICQRPGCDNPETMTGKHKDYFRSLYIFHELIEADNEEDWIHAVGQQLGYDGSSSPDAVGEFLSALSFFVSQQKTHVMPFIWYATFGRQLKDVQPSGPDESLINASFRLDEKLTTLPLRVELPARGPKDGIIILSATLLMPEEEGKYQMNTVSSAEKLPDETEEIEVSNLFEAYAKTAGLLSSINNVLERLSHELIAKVDREWVGQYLPPLNPLLDFFKKL